MHCCHVADRKRLKARKRELSAIALTETSGEERLQELLSVQIFGPTFMDERERFLLPQVPESAEGCRAGLQRVFIMKRTPLILNYFMPAHIGRLMPCGLQKDQLLIAQAFEQSLPEYKNPDKTDYLRDQSGLSHTPEGHRKKLQIRMLKSEPQWLQEAHLFPRFQQVVCIQQE